VEFYSNNFQKFAPLWKECKKKDKVYKAEAIVCAGLFCEKTGSTLNGVEVFELIKRIFANDDQSSSDSDGASTDKLNNAAKTTARNTYLERVITALPHVMLTFHDGTSIDDTLLF
ncbi:unnamed protein product, partial [Anisakis simplex]|uniref:Condensin complex subunit 1 n=1 Tax=Anisakis simplex TaxID=6269 RepID=A0A0M3JI59_ANISI